jgi:hypothetical protein
MHKLAKLVLLITLLYSFTLAGQESIWLENELSQKAELYFTKNPNLKFHSALKSYHLPDSIKNEVYGPEKWPIFFKKEAKNSSIEFSPLIHSIGGFSMSDSSFAIGQLGIGLAMKGNFGTKFYYSASAYFEDGKYPGYISDYIELKGVIPGMGRAYPGSLGYNFTRFDLLLSYQPTDFLRLEAGIGKHFIGEGYHSFFVSDVASNNPFGQLNVNIWHLNFSATYSSMSHLEPGSDPDWQKAKKFSARHYLSWNVIKSLRIGFFESVVWQASDSNYYRGFDPFYINPIQFYRPVEYSIGSSDNSLLGFDFSLKIKKRWILYSQFMLDEFLLREISSGNGWWANKFAIQIGLKAFEPFNSKGLFVRAEFNLARPFTFSHGSSKQNYAQLGEAIGHPLGSNFYEGLLQINIDIGKYGRLENLILAYIKGIDPEGENLGGDIFKSYTNPTNTYGNYITQGDQKVVGIYRVQYSYLLSKENRIKLVGGLQLRGERFLGSTSISTQVFAGISSTIWNRYADF